ncbi:MAG: TIGR02147 family protein [Oligoflexales bacterium]
MKSKQVSILDFSDYREFLANYKARRTVAGKKISFESIGKKVGMTKVGIKYIIDKKRHIADEKIPDFSKFFRFSTSEKKYFGHLVRYNKATKPAVKDQHFQKMLAIRNSSLNECSLDGSDLSLFAEWYYPVVAEMSYLEKFSEDPTWIQERLSYKLSKEQIEKALLVVKKLGLLKGQNYADLKIKLPDELISQIYNRFEREIILKGVDHIASKPRADRESFNLCISVDENKFGAAKELIKEFRHKLHDLLASTDSCDRVVQINMQLFTTAKEQKNHA